MRGSRESQERVQRESRTDPESQERVLRESEEDPERIRIGSR